MITMRFRVETWNPTYGRWDVLGQFNCRVMAERWANYHRTRGDNVRIVEV